MQNHPHTPEQPAAKPPGLRSYLGNALRGAFGAASVGAVLLGAAGAAIAAAGSLIGLDVAGALSGAEALTGSLAGAQIGGLALAGATVGAAAGAAIGAPTGAGMGLMAVREKFVEEQVIPQVANAALAKGVEIGTQMQRAKDVAEFQAAAQMAHAGHEAAKPVVGKYTQAYASEKTAQALAAMEPMGRA